MRRIIIIFIFLFMALSAEALAKANSIDFADAQIKDVLRALTRKAGLNLVMGSNLDLTSKRITVHFEDLSDEEAIDYILRVNGYTYQKTGKVILVSTLPQDISNTAYRSVFKTIDLKYLQAERVKDILSKIASEVVVIPGEKASSLIIKGKPSDIESIQELISSLDQPVPQILIESKVVEVSESGLQDLGVTWGKTQGSFKFTVSKTTRKISPTEDLEGTLDALISEGKAKVMARPRIATLDNHEAVINIGSRIPYAVPTGTSATTTQWTVQYIDAGVSLKITPRLGEDGLITTTLEPEVSSVSEWRATAAGEFPVISTRNAKATIRVKEGHTIFVGGLINEGDRENVAKIPILGDIPLLGLCFQRKVVEKTKTDIVFLITPYVI
jgi:type II secretory pathway component GspD/PulD (secretin)